MLCQLTRRGSLSPEKYELFAVFGPTKEQGDKYFTFNVDIVLCENNPTALLMNTYCFYSW